jgi:hypothetical protein
MQPTNKRLTVSVIIPTYNRAGFIGEAIDSALNQTRVPDEIIVVDDGSTDDTPRVLSAYQAPVRVIRQENRGRSAARNAGLAAARSDAVIFLDSDDTLLPTNIERLAKVLEENPLVGVAYSDSYIVDENLDVIGLHSQVMPGPRPSGMILGALACRCFLTVTALIRRTALAGIEFEEGMAIAEDYDVWRRVAAKAQFFYVDEPLMRYRFHDQMTTAQNLMKVCDAELDMQLKIMQMREFQELPGRVQARAFCTHGGKNAMLGRTKVARHFFGRAIRVAPAYPGGYVLGFLSLLGTRALQAAIMQRRRVLGNQFGIKYGAEVIAQQREAARDKPAAAAMRSGPPTATAEPVTVFNDAIHS